MSLSAANLFVVAGEEPEMKRARFAQEDAAGKKSSKDTGSSAEVQEDSEEDEDSEEAAAEARALELAAEDGLQVGGSSPIGTYFFVFRLLSFVKGTGG